MIMLDRRMAMSWAALFAFVLPVCVDAGHGTTGLAPVALASRTPGVQQPLPDPAPPRSGAITGIVVGEQQRPIVRVMVQVFPAALREPQASGAPFPGRASGTAPTDVDGRFRVDGLAPGAYVVAAQVQPFLPSAAASPATLYGTTFHPSTLDIRQAARVAVEADGVATAQIALVPVRGARVSGTVVSPAGTSTAGLTVSLHHAFGMFGSGTPVATVAPGGTFVIPRVPPGTYELAVGTLPSMFRNDGAEFVVHELQVGDRDVDGLALTLGRGATLTGRIVTDAGLVLAAGLRVAASPVQGMSALQPLTTTAAADGTFQLPGLSGAYRLGVRTDRPPDVTIARIEVGGAERPADAVLDLAGHGELDVAIHVTPASPRPPAVDLDPALSPGALVDRFKAEPVFWRQSEIGDAIVARGDTSVLPALEDWLAHPDRHTRANVAFIHGRLGDPRGFDVLAGMLDDRSARPQGQGIPGGRPTLEAQIRTDRYFAVHTLGRLGNARAVPLLVALLRDADVAYAVPSALARIGDARAIAPLIDLLDADDPSTRVLAIYALEDLRAREALPHLRRLLADERRSTVGNLVTVADAARVAIRSIE
jgi:hypothetical protein